MAKLEQYINEHRSDFDNEFPPDGHLGRFLEKLGSEEGVNRPRPARIVLKIAAVITILVSIGAVFFEYSARQQGGTYFLSRQEERLSRELQEALLFYSNETTHQMARLNSLASKDQNINEISSSIALELANLDQSTNELKKQLSQNPGNELIEAAVIQNQQMKQVILNKVINQISNKKTR